MVHSSVHGHEYTLSCRRRRIHLLTDVKRSHTIQKQVKILK